MIGLLVPIFLRMGLAQRVARALAIGTLILGATLLLAALWLWLDSREKADDRANQDIGATIQREGDLRETIERTEQGNEAREEMREAIRTGDPAAYDACVRTARTPANCRRFLPERPAD